MEEAKVQQSISSNSGAMLADGDKDNNRKTDASCRVAANDNTAMPNTPAPASSSSTITDDILKKEGSYKKKKNVFVLQNRFLLLHLTSQYRKRNVQKNHLQEKFRMQIILLIKPLHCITEETLRLHFLKWIRWHK